MRVWMWGVLGEMVFGRPRKGLLRMLDLSCQKSYCRKSRFREEAYDNFIECITLYERRFLLPDAYMDIHVKYIWFRDLPNGVNHYDESFSQR